MILQALKVRMVLQMVCYIRVTSSFLLHDSPCVNFIVPVLEVNYCSCMSTPSSSSVFLLVFSEPVQINVLHNQYAK